MKRITIVFIVVLIVAATIGIGSGCATDKASVAELSKACKRCYTLEHAPYDPHAFDQFSVKDLQVASKTTSDFSGAKITIWSVRAKLYDPNNQYVGDMEENLAKTSFGWLCQ